MKVIILNNLILNNLNLGCPSKTVVTKGRGAGFLDRPDELDKFLDEIFSKCDMKISIKTRLGMDDPEEFEDLLTIYKKYPLPPQMFPDVAYFCNSLSALLREQSALPVDIFCKSSADPQILPDHPSPDGS